MGSVWRRGAWKEHGEAGAGVLGVDEHARRGAPRSRDAAMARPSPLPPGLVVVNGSNSRSCTVGGMPAPSSITCDRDGAARRTRRRSGAPPGSTARGDQAHARAGTRGLQGVEHEIEDGAVQQVFVPFHDEPGVGHADLEAHAVGPFRMRAARRAAPRTTALEVDRLATR